MVRICKYVFLMVSLSVLLSCGSPADDYSYSGNDTSSSVSLNSMTVSPATLSLGSSFAIDWSVSYTSPSSTYRFELYVSDVNSITSPNINDTQVLGLNCGLSAQSCGSTGHVSCQYLTDNSGPYFLCSTGSSSTKHDITFSGTAYAIGRVCIYNASMDYVCSDEKSVQLLLQ